MDLSVIIVSFNTADLLRACLDSIKDFGSAYEIEVIVVDNGSADGSASMIRDNYGWVRLLDAGENLGFARACNLGVAASTGDYVLLLNPDTVVEGRAIDRLMEFARANPSAGVYGGRTLRPDRSVDPSSCWARQTPWSVLCYSLGLTTAFPRSRVFDREAMGRWERDTIRSVDIVTGCLLLTSRRVWEELGGFDERFFMYGEDADLCLRAARAGYRPAITPEATITHVVGASSPSPAAKRRLMMTGKVTLIDSHWSAPAATIGRFLLAGGVALRAGGSRILGRGNAPWVEVWKRRSEWQRGWPPAPGGAESDPLRD